MTSLPAPVPSSASVRRRLQRQPSRNTPIEIAFRSALHRRGMRFRIQQRPLPGCRRVVDIVFTRQKVAVFIDGCFWHVCPDPAHFMWPRANAAWWRQKLERNQARDRDTDERLRALGWTPFRVWEHEQPDAAADRLVALLHGERSA